VRGVAGEAPRWNTYRDNYVTFCFATTRDFFLASVPAPHRAPIGPTPRNPGPRAGSFRVRRGAGGEMRGRERTNEFIILESGTGGELNAKCCAICMPDGSNHGNSYQDCENRDSKRIR